MRNHWRRNSVIAILFSSATLAVGQAQQQSGANISALGPDYQQGKADLDAGKYEAALKAFKKANKQQNDACAPCLLEMSFVMARLGDTKGALNSADKALASAQTDELRAEAHAMRGDVLLGQNDEKKRSEAESEYRSAVHLNPQAPEHHLKLALALLKEVKDTEGKDELNQYVQLAPNGKYAAYARTLLANPRRAREDYAPEFSFTTLRGDTITLNALAGKFVVLDFWATWCPPCRASIGELKELTRKYPRDKVVLISVSADEEEDKWREFVAKKEMDWDQYRDSAGKIQKTFGIHAFPTYIVIDPEGIIRQRILGENPQQSVVARLKSVLTTLTADKGKA